MSDAVATAVEVQADYTVRGRDFDTILLGAITGSIIDAARFVREGRYTDSGWRNGFPNWALYRTALAGDTHLALNLRAWCEAFGIAHVTEHTRAPSDAVGVCAGRDAYYWITTKRWGAPSDELAEALGIAPKTYRKIRGQIAARLMVSLDEYFMRLGIALREVALLERRQETAQDAVRLSDGRGWGHEISADGDGNYRAMPRGSGC